MVKKLKSFAAYFFYLAWNWNVRIALFIIKHEIAGEKKYNIDTIGIDELHQSVSEQDRKHASIYQPVNYYISEWLFKHISKKNHLKKARFLDAGCGKGRAMVMAAAYGFTKITGIDISPSLCRDASITMETIQRLYPETFFSIEQADAGNYKIPDDTGVIFLFNPFDHVIMARFVEQVMASIHRNPRHVMLLYSNPEARDLWVDAGFRVTDSIKRLTWLQGLIMEYYPA